MPRTHEVKVTWKDVDRVRQANPTWTYPEIAKALKTSSAYVRATFARRKWAPRPSFNRPPPHIRFPSREARAT